MYKKYFKRFFDFMFAIAMLIFVAPIMTICALLIKLEDPRGPILFKQRRVGENSQPFTVMKFRSMETKTEVNGQELSDEERMLRTGNVIRKLSLDELPQLFNVIKGEMSFIGPRPLPVVYLPYYSEKELHRHDVKPGISGLAQVNGRNNLKWEEKFSYDLEYTRNIGIITDIKIVLLTAMKVFKRSDISVRKTNEKDQSLDEIREPIRDIEL